MKLQIIIINNSNASMAKSKCAYAHFETVGHQEIVQAAAE